jgi:hypothetical protein
VAIFVSSCSGADGTDEGAIRENVVDPGVAAIESGGGADLAACESDASILLTALDAYEAIEGEPAADADALVEAGLLREPSELWTVADGSIVAVDERCADVPTDEPDIVTDVETPSADEVYAGFLPDEVEAFGGEACARELAEVFAAGERFVAEEGSEPTDLEQLVDAGFLDPLELWVFRDGNLVPAEGSGCVGST